ncbi:MAG: exopolysaccharide biosynthesis protein [Rhodospirillales bacterium]
MLAEPEDSPQQPDREPTSLILARLLEDAREETVTLAWVTESLRERSFAIVVLMIALVGLVPGIATVVGLLLAWPALQMLAARPAPRLPGFIARREVSTAKLARLVSRLIPLLTWLEQVVRPRWALLPLRATEQVVGGVILLLSVTLLAPIPFSHVIPLLVVMLLAFALLEEDGLLLAIGFLAALVSLTITAAAVWGTIEAGLLL